MDRGARRAIIQGVTKSWTQLNNTSTFHVEQDSYIQYYKEKLLNFYNITNCAFGLNNKVYTSYSQRY